MAKLSKRFLCSFRVTTQNVVPQRTQKYGKARLHIGERAFTTCVAPPVSCKIAVTFLGAVLETNPQKKLVSPFPGDPPSQTGLVNLNVIVLPVCAADANPIVPSPPLVTTKT